MKKSAMLLAVFLTVGLVVITVHGQEKKSAAAIDATPFLGTWRAQFQDATFMVLTLHLEKGKLAGKLSTGHVAVNASGAVNRVNQKADASLATEIRELRVIGRVLSFKHSKADSFEMKLTGNNEATLKPLLPADEPTLQPFHMRREVKE